MMEEFNGNRRMIEAMLANLIHMQEELAVEIRSRLTGIEDGVHLLSRAQVSQEAYSTADFARLVDRDVYTVREWCRLERIRATKRQCGRGNSPEWMISHDELMRYRREGLLLHRRA